MKTRRHPDGRAARREAADQRDDAAENDRKQDPLDRLADDLDRRDILRLRAARRRIREQEQR